MVEKRGVHGLAHRIVAAETEGDVGNAAADLGVGEVGFDPTRGLDEIDGVVVVLLDAGADGEDVGIENDVLGREADLVNEEAVSAFADADLFGVGRGLTVFVEGHHDDGGTVAENGARLFEEFFLALFERDGVHDALALKTFQTGLDDLPFGGVDHDRDFGNLRLGADELEETRHGGDAVDQAVVHADVDDVGAVVDLLAGDRDGFLVVAGFDELGELRRAGDVGALADHEVGAGDGREGQGAGEGHLGLHHRAFAHGLFLEGLRDGGDVLGGVAAATAGDVAQVAVGELAHKAGHVVRLEIEAGGREGIWQAGVRVAGDKGIGLAGELGEKRPHEIGSDGAVEADGERIVVPHGVPIGADRLRGDHGLAATPDGGGDHEREFDFVLGEHFLDGDERSLGVEGVEDRFDEQQVHAAGDQGAHLAAVVGFALVEGDDAEAGVVGVRGVRERYRQRPDGAGDVAAATGGGMRAVGADAALAGGVEIDVVRELLEELVLDDLLVERGRLLAAFLAWVFDEEFALPDCGGGEGVGLDDVGAGLEEAPVDVADLIGAGEGINVAVVLEVLGGVFEAFAAGLRLGNIVTANGRAHGAIDDDHALRQRAAEGDLGFGHERGRLRHGGKTRSQSDVGKFSYLHIFMC